MTADEIYNLGYVELKKGDAKQAIEHFFAALGVDPNHHRSHFGLALAYERMGDLDKAIEHYRKSIQIEPTYHKAHNNLGELLRHQGRFEEAIDSFEIACQLSSTSANYFYNLGLTYKDLGNMEKAREAFERAYRLDPNDHEIVNELSSLCFNLKDTQTAVNVLSEFVNKNDNHTRIFEFKMKLNALKKKLEKDK